jgi:hypothetical protein
MVEQELGGNRERLLALNPHKPHAEEFSLPYRCGEAASLEIDHTLPDRRSLPESQLIAAVLPAAYGLSQENLCQLRAGDDRVVFKRSGTRIDIVRALSKPDFQKTY